MPAVSKAKKQVQTHRCTAHQVLATANKADDADPTAPISWGNKCKRKAVPNYGVIECKYINT
jgi:hypothetical protein